jgi:hypothetical protein
MAITLDGADENKFTSLASFLPPGWLSELIRFDYNMEGTLRLSPTGMPVDGNATTDQT